MEICVTPEEIEVAERMTKTDMLLIDFDLSSMGNTCKVWGPHADTGDSIERYSSAIEQFDGTFQETKNISIFAASLKLRSELRQICQYDMHQQIHDGTLNKVEARYAFMNKKDCDMQREYFRHALMYRLVHDELAFQAHHNPEHWDNTRLLLQKTRDYFTTKHAHQHVNETRMLSAQRLGLRYMSSPNYRIREMSYNKCQELFLLSKNEDLTALG